MTYIIEKCGSKSHPIFDSLFLFGVISCFYADNIEEMKA